MLLRMLVLSLSLLLAISAAGCNFSSKPKRDGQLVIMYPYKVDYYMQTYITPFKEKYPELQLSVVYGEEKVGAEQFTDEAYLRLIESEHPDVVFLLDKQYAQLSGENRLTDLDPFIRKDHFDMDGIYPPLISYLKTYAQGKLEGLAADYRTNALFLNEELFERYGVPLPKGTLTWDEVLNLAGRFASVADDGRSVYGFDHYDPIEQSNAFALIRAIGESQGLSMFDEKNRRIVVNNGKWRPIFEKALEDLRSGAIHPNALMTEVTAPFEAPFLRGEAAMMTSNSDMVYFLNELEKITGDKGLAAKRWDIIPAPVHSAKKDRGISLSTNVYAIPFESDSKEDAWNFIKFVNSDETMRALSKTGFKLQSRVAYIPPLEGKNVKAFFPDSAAEVVIPNRPDLPGFIEELNRMAVAQLQGVLDGRMTLDDALE
ncbi:MAG: extracellular solute-binding protein, partial [Cohnella sp.]|nr:extracellular solute-binding protein [Cohnella sp.]